MTQHVVPSASLANRFKDFKAVTKMGLSLSVVFSSIAGYLLAADEVFITNAIKGVNWIGAYRTKKFSNTIARKLIISLNEFWRSKLEQ